MSLHVFLHGRTGAERVAMSERCSHARADGVPCRSYAVEDGLCRAHLKARARHAGQDIRARLAADAADAYEQILDAIKQAVTAETTRWGDCPHCKHRVPVTFPDIQARTRALELWLNQGLGKPVERVETSATEELREQVQSLEQMTDEELRELRLKLIVESVENAALGRYGRRPPAERKQHVRDRLRDCLGELLEVDGPAFARVFRELDEQAA
jgi:hypothetical protein